jgi:hypothetical protein
VTPAIQLGAGVVTVGGGWFATRFAGRCGFRFDRWLLLDALLPALLFGLLLTAGGRPIFAGVLTLAVGSGYAYAEQAKRKTLAEPIVFTDVFQALDIFRHPQLAMPFPNRLPIFLSVAGAVAVFVGLFVWERPVGVDWPWPFLGLLVGLFAGCGLIAGPANVRLARSLRDAGLGGQPFIDTARFGTLGTLLGYGIVARAERPVRRQANPAPPSSIGSGNRSRPSPVLLVQCESFFDARRLGPGIAADLLPAFDSACGQSLQWGRLTVPCWGANTVRTEFAVLSGLAESQIGMDRFNPYYRFAHQPVNTLAWRFRQRGYRTVCVHPFDRRFYGRDVVMPQLGFDVFLGEEAFIGAPRINGYVADEAIGEVVETLVSEHREGIFVFVITLENHGPWPAEPLFTTARHAPGLLLPPKEAASLQRYLTSLRNGDALLAALMARGEDHRLIGFYGDHQPSLRLSVGQPADNASDYVIWQAGRSGRAGRVDLAAHEFSEALLNAVAH